MRVESGEFAYITITEGKLFRDGMDRYYDEFLSVAAYFGKKLPQALLGTRTHLDPDFDRLTYGDQGQRGKRIKELLRIGDLRSIALWVLTLPVQSRRSRTIRWVHKCEIARFGGGFGADRAARRQGKKAGTGEIVLKHWRHWEGDQSVTARFRIRLEMHS
jgi:hypothetical protein